MRARINNVSPKKLIENLQICVEILLKPLTSLANYAIIVLQEEREVRKMKLLITVAATLAAVKAGQFEVAAFIAVASIFLANFARLQQN